MSALIAQIPSLRRYAAALSGSAVLADDLVQDSIERALRQERQLRELALMPGWLRRILHNLYIDGIRRNRSQGPQSDIDDLADRLELSVSQADGIPAREFLRALNELSIEHRQILLMVGLEGLSYRAIADELAIPMGTVMSRLARAREQLRMLLENGSSNVVLLRGAP